MCQTCDNNEKAFKKMMGEEINCWMWNFHNALPYVADLVISGVVTLDENTDTKKIAEECGTDKHNGEDIYGLLDLFLAFTKPEEELDFDACSLSEESMREHNLIPMDIVSVVEGNPVKVARLLSEAQKEFKPVYSGKVN